MSEIEKQFFETFEIEPKEIYWCEYDNKICDCQYDCDENCRKIKRMLPPITDHILLELICLNSIYLWGIHPNTVNELKNVLLEKYIEHVNLMADENEKQEHIHQVQALFKEDN